MQTRLGREIAAREVLAPPEANFRIAFLGSWEKAIGLRMHRATAITSDPVE
jgi:hypothetical protein